MSARNQSRLKATINIYQDQGSLKDMSDLLKKINSQINTLKSIANSIKAIEKNDQDEIKRLNILVKEINQLDKQTPKLEDNTTIRQETFDICVKAKEEAKTIERKAIVSFGNELERLLSEQGLSLEGTYPKLKCSFYTITIDIPRNLVNIYFGPEIERISSCEALPVKVCDEIVKVQKKLLERNLDNNSFIENLYQAYDLCLKRLGKEKGSEIPVADILFLLSYITQSSKFMKNPIKSNFIEYDRILFSYDLHNLKSRTYNGHELILVTAPRSKTRNRYDNLWIPPASGKGIGTAISGIKFTEEHHGQRNL